MKITIFCRQISATEQLCFGFDQSHIAMGRRISFSIIEFSSYKKLTHEAQSLIIDQAYQADCIIFSRWFEDYSFRVIKEAGARGIPLIFYIDDLLTSVPMSVGMRKYEHYKNPELQNRLRRIMEECDHVVCSTHRLSSRYKSLYQNINTHVCPVHSLYSPNKSYTTSFSSCPRPYPVIGYMGSASHTADLKIVIEPIMSIMEEFPLLVFETFGIELPYQIQEKYPLRCRYIKSVTSYWEFREYLRSLGWWIGLAPLEDSEFNICKSDTKLVEYTHAGIPVVASDCGPYMDVPLVPKCSNDSGADEWYIQIRSLLESCNNRRLCFDRMHSYFSDRANADAIVGFYTDLVLSSKR